MVSYGRVVCARDPDKKSDFQFRSSKFFRLTRQGYQNRWPGRVLRNDNDDGNKEATGTGAGARAQLAPRARAVLRDQPSERPTACRDPFFRPDPRHSLRNISKKIL